ncbi:MAG: heme exporter protein CcmD [Hyphomicrobiales bacterium]
MGKYLLYISWAYGFAGVALLSLVVITWRDLARQHRLLGELEAKGLRRRRPAAPAAPIASVDASKVGSKS